MSVVGKIIASFLIINLALAGFLPIIQKTKSFGPIWTEEFDFYGVMWADTMDWSPDGSHIVLGWDDLFSSVNFLNASDGEPLGPVIHVTERPSSHTIEDLLLTVDTLSSLSYSPDGERVVISTWEAPATIYSVSDGEAIMSFGKYPRLVRSVDWSPDGRFIAATAENVSMYVVIWDAFTGEDILAVPFVEYPYPLTLEWSPDGSMLAYTDTQHSIIILSALDGSVIVKLTGHLEPILDFSWSPDGAKMASSSWDGTLRIWDAASGNEILRAMNDSRDDGEPWSGLVRASDWSPDGLILAVLKENEEEFWKTDLLLFETENFTQVGNYRIDRRARSSGAVQWSPDGNLLAVALEKGWVSMWGDVIIERFTPLFYILLAVPVGALSFWLIFTMRAMWKGRPPKKSARKSRGPPTEKTHRPERKEPVFPFR